MKFLPINWLRWRRDSFVPSLRKERDSASPDSGNFHSHHTQLPSARLHFNLVLPGRLFSVEFILIDRWLLPKLQDTSSWALQCCNIVALWNIMRVFFFCWVRNLWACGCCPANSNIAGYFSWQQNVQERFILLLIHTNPANRGQYRLLSLNGSSEQNKSGKTNYYATFFYITFLLSAFIF